MSKHRWIQLGAFLSFEFAIGAQLAGMIRSVRYGDTKLSDLLNDPMIGLSLDHYKDTFQVDPLNALLYGLMGWTALSGIKYALSGRISVQENYEEAPEFGSGGTARWMTKEEIKDMYYQSQSGIPLGSIEPGPKDKKGTRFIPFKKEGKYATLSPEEGKNENVFILGPSGSNKTVSIVLPMITKAMMLGESIVVTDLKGELHDMTRKDLEKNGYRVFVLDFIKRMRGNHWNAIMSLHADEEDDIRKTANAFVQGSKVAKGKSGSSDPLWEEAEENILAALMGYVLQLYPKEEHTFENVIKVLHSLKDAELSEDLFEMNGVTGAPLSWYNDFLLTADSDKMRASIIGSLATNLSKLASKGLKAMISKNDFAFEDLAKQKTAIFIMIPPNDKTFASFITVFWQQMFDKLYNFAFEHSGSLPTKVRCILEEKANIGKIGTLKEVLSTSRSLGLKINIVYQDINQPKDQYGEGWETLAGNCDTWIVLGCNDNTSADYLSKKIGKTTVKVQNTSHSKDGDQLLEKKSSTESYSYQQRELLTPDEVQRFGKDRLIVLPNGMNPVFLYKIQYQHWKYRFCDSSPYFDLPLLNGLREQVNNDHSSIPFNEEVKTEMPILVSEQETETEGNIMGKILAAAREDQLNPDAYEEDEVFIVDDTNVAHEKIPEEPILIQFDEESMKTEETNKVDAIMLDTEIKDSSVDSDKEVKTENDISWDELLGKK
ncbi:VirD4-like conjugal transfer protein, CD1115 family [Paenibacillus lutrae]|uniref:TraM recognition domain-containing protein n=1 Tax=Paenibacillus lutrae TaxID=2078573 RepID=A0A7X3FLV8_9BACL|nr:type IV secretory system conjugative DNA transfer family protein [Paenibacillus lutrae]MVP02135.1 TraM recognition domain-containing protein [Paenibacillus lutrae]